MSKNGNGLFVSHIMCAGSLVRAARNVTMRALGHDAKAMETLAKKKRIPMKGTPTLLSLAVGLALASPSLHAAGLVARPTVPSPPSPPSGAAATRAPSSLTIVRKPRQRLGQGWSLALGKVSTRASTCWMCRGMATSRRRTASSSTLNDKNFASKYPDIQPGALVCLEAKVEEYHGHTQLKPLFDGSTPRLTTLARAPPRRHGAAGAGGETLARPWNVTKGCGAP